MAQVTTNFTQVTKVPNKDSSSQVQFDQDATVFAGQLQALAGEFQEAVPQFNALHAEVVNGAATVEAVGTGYLGAWADQTGSVAKGKSVSHSGTLWLSQVDIADITASEPSSTNTDWSRLGAQSGTVKIQATGTLANGDPVALRSDGTVEVVSGVMASASASAEFESVGSAIGITACYDTLNDKLVIAYKDSGYPYHGKAVVGTVSSGSITFGTPVTFQTGATDHIDVCFDSINNKVVIVYQDDDSGDHLKAKVGTVSGNTITFGDEANVVSDAIYYISCCFNENQGVAVIVYALGNSIETRAGTVSGDSISFGSEVILHGQYSNYLDCCCIPNTDKVLYAYVDGSTSVRAINLRVGTLSGNSISLGYEYIPEYSVATFYELSLGYDVKNDRAILLYLVGEETKMRIVKVEGTDIEYGKPETVLTRGSVTGGVFYNPMIERTVLLSRPSRSNTYGQIAFIDINDLDCEIKDPIIFKSESINYMIGLHDPDTDQFLVSYNSAGGQAIVMDYAPSGVHRWIGFSETDTTDGQATVTVPGGINSGQTGLTPGSRYYLQDDGSLSTDAAGRYVGMALSETEILVESS